MTRALPDWPASLSPFGALRPLSASFFERPVPDVARDLLGKVLLSRADGAVCGGRIVETEAYLGSGDEGSHAATRGITRRNAVMYGPPGTAYVYFTYGNHHMLNIVCEREGVAGAVLVRALEPLAGADVMSKRRGRTAPQELASGPGRLAKALAADLSDNGAPLGSGRLSVFDAPAPEETVAASGRIGLSRGHEDDLRFYLVGNAYVSRARPGRRVPARMKGRPPGGIK